MNHGGREHSVAFVTEPLILPDVAIVPGYPSGGAVVMAENEMQLQTAIPDAIRRTGEFRNTEIGGAKFRNQPVHSTRKCYAATTDLIRNRVRAGFVESVDDQHFSIPGRSRLLPSGCLRLRCARQSSGHKSPKARPHGNFARAVAEPLVSCADGPKGGRSDTNRLGVASLEGRPLVHSAKLSGLASVVSVVCRFDRNCRQFQLLGCCHCKKKEVDRYGWAGPNRRR
ncbi:hypothetical protein ACVIWU_006469 [Bradyrhizobium sp. USDA 4509]